MKKYIILLLTFISCVAETNKVTITYRDGISGINGSSGDIEFNITGASFNREVQVSLGSNGEFTPEIFRETRVFSYKDVIPGDYTYTIAIRSSNLTQSSSANNPTSNIANLAARNNSKSGVITVKPGITTIINFKL